MVDEIGRGWENTTTSVETVDWSGKNLKLKDVPAFKHEKTGEVLVDINDVIKVGNRTEQQNNANEMGLEPIEIHPLLLLYADLKYYPQGVIEKGYRLRKMIFYLEKEMEKSGYKDSYTFDEIVPARAGPVPKNLKKTIKELSQKGLVNYVWENKPGTPAKFNLTKKGFEVAKKLWTKTPDDIQKVILKVKEGIYLISSEDLKNKVHKEYPEYQRTYVDLDGE